MVKNSLGLIEIVGLAAALEAADAAMKAANVELIGYELTKGGGLVLVKLQGDVGAVKVAVEAGRIAGSKVNKVCSTQVIPRPHQQLHCMVVQEKSLGTQDQTELLLVNGIEEVIAEVEVTTEAEAITEVEVVTETEVTVEIEAIEEYNVQPETQPERQQDELIEAQFPELNHENSECDRVSIIVPKEKKAADICNLCSDPACRRKKGDPKITCMYHGKNNKEAE